MLPVLISFAGILLAAQGYRYVKDIPPKDSDGCAAGKSVILLGLNKCLILRTPRKTNIRGDL